MEKLTQEQCKIREYAEMRNDQVKEELRMARMPSADELIDEVGNE